MAALKLLFIFILIMLAIRKKISVGITLTGAGLIMAVLFQISFKSLMIGYYDLIKSHTFITLTLVVIFITYMGSLLKELGFLEKLSTAVQGLPGGNKTAVALLPPMIGMMPMPGGSLLSAPLVDNVLKKGNYTPEHKLLANYWFRHVAEFFWPLYSGMILTEAITGLPMYKVSLMQFPLSVSMAIIGYYFFIRKIKNNNSNNSNNFSLLTSIWNMFKSVWAILLAISLYAILKVDLSISVLIAIILLMLIARPSKEAIIISLKKSLSLKLIMLLFGVLSFQMIIELSRAVEFIPALATTYNLPEIIIVFLVTFTIGILTGMVSAYVGLGYAILAGFLYQPELNSGLIMIAYMSGFVGVMLSPSHLCLILTNEYFGSDLMKVFRRLVPIVSLLIIAGLILYFSPWPDLFIR
ncbi:MAG: DUF401 family protein [candidate division Zixibacteria bacterium]|nr:DUF401 family protein [candidate division Zixibacteria bacterium]